MVGTCSWSRTRQARPCCPRTRRNAASSTLSAASSTTMCRVLQGASNHKWTDAASKLEAHVEAPELGSHTITISNQPGCTVTGGIVVSDGRPVIWGPASVTITVKSSNIKDTWYISVYCN